MSAKLQINKYKLAAIHLLKSIKDRNIESQQKFRGELNRLLVLPEFKGASLEQLLSRNFKISIDQCRLVIACENGYESWDDLLKENSPKIDELSDEELFHIVDATDGFLNAWFATYEEAKLYHNSQKRSFLFPCKSTYFVCFEDHIKSLGVDPKDNDWDLIGRDWVESSDSSAKDRLREKLKHAREKID